MSIRQRHNSYELSHSLTNAPNIRTWLGGHLTKHVNDFGILLLELYGHTCSKILANMPNKTTRELFPSTHIFSKWNIMVPPIGWGSQAYHWMTHSGTNTTRSRNRSFSHNPLYGWHSPRAKSTHATLLWQINYNDVSLYLQLPTHTPSFQQTLASETSLQNMVI